MTVALEPFWAKSVASNEVAGEKIYVAPPILQPEENKKNTRHDPSQGEEYRGEGCRVASGVAAPSETERLKRLKYFALVRRDIAPPVFSKNRQEVV